MEITKNTFGKMNKQQLGEVLALNYKSVARKDKNLSERIAYASKHDATKKDLLDLVKEAVNLLDSKFKMSVAAEEPKTPEEPKPEAPKVENSVKPAAKKPVKKPAKVETLEDDNPNTKVIQRASKFADEITVGDDTYVKSPIKSLKELSKKFEDDPEANILFGFYQPKRNLKQFGYCGYIKPPKSFEDDIDVSSVIYVSDESVVAYAVSITTEAIYAILPEDFEYVDGIRVSGACEFEIYELKVEPKPEAKRKPRKSAEK